MERPVLVIPADHIPEITFFASGQVNIYGPSDISRMSYSANASKAKKHYARAMYELALATYFTAKDAEAKAKAKEARKAKKTDA